MNHTGDTSTSRKAGPLGWTDTMPPEQIEARNHPLPNVHDQDEVDHVIHSTFRQMGKPAQAAPTPKDSIRLSACAKVAACLVGGYAFGCALVALSNTL